MEAWREELYRNELYHAPTRYFGDELYHHGILGMKWGVRRYQNADGSLTALGRVHSNVGDPRVPSKGKLTLAQKRNVRADQIADANRAALKKQDRRIMSRADANKDSARRVVGSFRKSVAKAEADYKAVKKAEADALVDRINGVNKALDEKEAAKEVEALRKRYGIDAYKAPEQVREIAKQKAREEAETVDAFHDSVRKAAKDAETAKIAEEDRQNRSDLAKELRREQDEVEGKKAVDAFHDSVRKAAKEAEDKRIRDAEEEERKRYERDMELERTRPKTDKELTEDRDRYKLEKEHNDAQSDLETGKITKRREQIEEQNKLNAAEREARNAEQEARNAAYKQAAAAYEQAGKSYSSAGTAFGSAGKFQKTLIDNERAFRSNQTWTRKTEKELAEMSTQEFSDLIKRMELEKSYSALTANDVLEGRQKVSNLLYDIGTISYVASGVANTASALYSLKQKFDKH